MPRSSPPKSFMRPQECEDLLELQRKSHDGERRAWAKSRMSEERRWTLQVRGYQAAITALLTILAGLAGLK